MYDFNLIYLYFSNTLADGAECVYDGQLYFFIFILVTLTRTA